MWIVVAMITAGTVMIVGATGQTVVDIRRSEWRRRRVASEVAQLCSMALFMIAGVDLAYNGVDDGLPRVIPLATVVHLVHIGLSYLPDRRPKDHDRVLPTPMNSPSA